MTVRPDVRPHVPFARDLDRHGERVALITPAGQLTYHDLAARVARAAERLGDGRRLVLLAAANSLDAVVAYLAALAAGHPVLLAPGGDPRTVERLTAAYDPDVVVAAADGRWRYTERRDGSAHRLHPDLALLLTTSGSTGSPKLVRLSQRNLQANAEAIAEYLEIGEHDRAATTLPVHYSYGLSVVNSHLLRGAGLILTDRSVTDPRFWEAFRAHRGTSFAGVPYTFDLLDRVGFDRMRLPDLRYVTQAGGRLAPERVRRYARLGRRDGWDLIVMYGQTEATARMAYLPAHLTLTHPQAIGRAVPGGSFRLEPLPEHPDPDVGELVYRGPNVMLGYAETPADLSLGRTVCELRTGDVARHLGDGLYELVGRRSRFAKIFGLRIDLQHIEDRLAGHGLTACCVGEEDRLVVAVSGDVRPERVRRLVADWCGLPTANVQAVAVAELPRLPSGKPDYPAVQALARDAARRPEPAAGETDLLALFAEVLGADEVTEDSSFTSLGGDSLSYVALSVRLEAALGRLPADWPTMTIRELRRHGTRARRWRRTLDTSVALRAIAIVLIAGTHIRLFGLAGGAHLLIGVAGYNFARFLLSDAERRVRMGHLWRSIARIAVPTVLWTAGAMLVTDDYGPTNLLLLNSVLGPHDGDSEWHFWFVEALVYILVAVTVALGVPAVDRAERRFPFALPVALAAAGLLTRYHVFGLADGPNVPDAVVVFWLFALGWAAARARRMGQRLLVSAAAAATVPGFFGQPTREAIIVGGLLLLIWVPRLPSLGPVNRLAGLLAGASLYIYLVHWQVYPVLDDRSRLLALVVSLAAGVGCARLAVVCAAGLRGCRHRLTAGRVRTPGPSRG
ncbi:MAG TPA: AMP-binding protein [Micromonosporaceae bacterium]